jgi:DNA-binding FadR family transcriptional regulator
MTKKKDIFIPIKGQRAFEDIASQIKKLVFKGILKPGERLPPEMDLAGKFNVSRQTIREGLRVLELSGFIKVQKGYGGGTFIKDTTLNKMGDLFLDTLRLEKITIDDLTVARLENERIILNYAIDFADETDIKALRENILRAKADLKKNKMATASNFEFHKLLAKASKNNVRVILMELILVALSHLLSRRPPNFETTRSAIEYHEKILEAIVRKDRETAMVLLEDHLKEVESQLKALPYDPEVSVAI